jgi:general secretion pathway protein C
MIKHAFTALNLLLIALGVYFGVNAFYLYTASRLDPSEPASYRNVSSSGQAETDRLPLSHYQPVVERNLFQTKATAAAIPQAVDVEGLQQTSLKLRLWGTVTGDEKEAYAVIEETGKRTQNLYRIGDNVQDATLKLILREKVVLSVKGRDEVLEIEKATSSPAGVRPAASYAAARPRAAQRSRPPRTQKITLRRPQIDEALQDVNQLLSDVSIRPHFQDGQPDGLMLSRVKPNSIFMRMGLRNGDVINGVDGQQLQTVDDAMSFYERLKNSDQVTVNLKRGGRERTIQYTIR